MRKSGLIGGLSWYSARSCHESINRGVPARMGAQASAPMLIAANSMHKVMLDSFYRQKPVAHDIGLLPPNMASRRGARLVMRGCLTCR